MITRRLLDEGTTAGLGYLLEIRRIGYDNSHVRISASHLIAGTWSERRIASARRIAISAPPEVQHVPVVCSHLLIRGIWLEREVLIASVVDQHFDLSRRSILERDRIVGHLHPHSIRQSARQCRAAMELGQHRLDAKSRNGGDRLVREGLSRVVGCCSFHVSIVAILGLSPA